MEARARSPRSWGHDPSPEERAAFERAGYLLRPRVFAASEVAALARALDRLAARAERLESTREVDGTTLVVAPTGTGDAPRLQRAVWCGAAEPVLEQAALDPRILEPVLALLDVSAVDQLINQAHFKTPGDGVRFGLHQDAWNRRWGTALWRHRGRDGAYVQALLTIDEMTEDNGPLLVVPGSHRAGPVLGPDRHERIAALAREQPPRAIAAPPGSLVFFGPFLVHGSEPNLGPRGRRVLVNGFAKLGVNRRRYPGAGLGVRRGREAMRALEER